MHPQGSLPSGYEDDQFENIRRGSGLGSIFSSIFSHVVPFVKSALRLGKRAAMSSVGRELTKHLKKSATNAGVAVVNDALQGKNILESSKYQVDKVAKSMGKKLSTMSERAVRGKKKKQGQGKKKGKKKKVSFGTGKKKVKKTKNKKKKFTKGKKKKGKAGKKKFLSKSGHAMRTRQAPTTRKKVNTLKDLWS